MAALKAYRSKLDEAEEQFIRACMAVEDSGIWHNRVPAKDITFGVFLERVDVCKAVYYDRRAAAIRSKDVHVQKSLSGAGLIAATLVNEVKDPTDRAKAAENVCVAALDAGGIRLPKTTAKYNIGLAIKGSKSRVPKTPLLEAEISRLQAELESARAEVRWLRKENTDLRERLSAHEDMARENMRPKGRSGKKESNRSQARV